MDPAETVAKDENPSPPTYAHNEKKDFIHDELEGRGRDNLNAVFENPLAGIPREQLLKNVEEFCTEFNLLNDLEIFKKGALISQDPANATHLPELNDAEREALVREHTHKWHQPWQLYFLTSKIPKANVMVVLIFLY